MGVSVRVWIGVRIGAMAREKAHHLGAGAVGGADHKALPRLLEQAVKDVRLALPGPAAYRDHAQGSMDLSKGYRKLGRGNIANGTCLKVGGVEHGSTWGREVTTQEARDACMGVQNEWKGRKLEVNLCVGGNGRHCKPAVLTHGGGTPSDGDTMCYNHTALALSVRVAENLGRWKTSRNPLFEST